MTVDGGLWRFLFQFAANCRTSVWTQAVEANVPLNEECIEAYDVLIANGVEAPPVTDAPHHRDLPHHARRRAHDARTAGAGTGRPERLRHRSVR